MLLAGTLTQFISVSADTQDDLQENKFYISRDGNDGKDGKSRANAVRNVKRVIELINAAGLGENDTATVYVDSTADGKPLTAVETMNDVVSYYNNENNNKLPLYACTVTFTSYNTDESGNGSDYLGYGHTNDVSNSFCSLAGPTVFENITLLDVTGREDNYWINYFNTRGNTVIFRNVRWSYIESRNWGYKTGVKKIINDKNKWTQENIFYAGNQYNNAAAAALERTSSQTVAFEGDDGYNLPKTFAFGNSSSKDEFKRSFAGDSTFIWGIKDKALNSAYLTNAKGTAGDAAAFNYNGNVNIVMKNGAKINNIRLAPDEENYIAPNIAGAVQLIANKGSVLNQGDIDGLKERYKVYAISNNSDTFTLGVTDTAGRYSVEGSGIAYVVTNGRIYYSKDGYISVPENKDGNLTQYNVFSAESIESLKELGWKENPNDPGVLVPNSGISDKYYLHVKNNGTGGEDFLGVSIDKDKLEAGKKYRLSFDYKSMESADVFKSDIVRVQVMASGTDWKKNSEWVSDSLKKAVIKKGKDTNGEFETVELSNDGTTDKAEFTFTLDATDRDRYGIVFNFIPNPGFANAEYWLSSLKLCAEGSDENILVNDGTTPYMKGWHSLRIGVFASDIANVFKVEREKADGTKYGFTAEYIDKIPEPEPPSPEPPAGEKKMLYFRNGSGWASVCSRFECEAGKTYRFEASISSQTDFQVFAARDGDRTAFEKNAKVIEKTEHGEYFHAVYEFTVPENADYERAFTGIAIPSGASGYLFDVSLYERDDPEKTELLSNPSFGYGLDYWAYDWYAWFIVGQKGLGLTEWTGGNGAVLKTMDFSEDALIRYTDDKRFNDGTWWKPEDAETAEIIKTATLSGTLSDQNGKPLANVKLLLEGDNGIKLNAVTDKNGRFVFKDIAEGFYDLYIIGSDGQKRTTDFFTTLEGGDTVTARLTLDNSQAKTENNNGVADTSNKNGAEITGSTLKGKVYTRALKTVSNLKLVIDGIGDVVTDKDGYFEFKNVKPGKYTVYTTFENGKKYVLRELEIKESVELSVKLLYDIKTGADKNEDQNGVNVLLIVLSAAAGVAVIGGAAVLIIFRKRIFK